MADMEDFSSRTAAVIGADGFERLGRSSVAVFGIGGVGGSAAEALGRAGVGRLLLIDGDRVAPSNLNRQAAAYLSTLGRYKAEVMRGRILDINPDADVSALNIFYGESTKNSVDFTSFDYIVDAIDQIPAKLLIIETAKKAGVRVISSMGAGNKLGTAPFEVADIYSTSVCPLARVMRRQLRAMGIDSLKVVYSKEPPVNSASPPGSMSFVPPMAGLTIAGEVIRDIISRPN